MIIYFKTTFIAGKLSAKAKNTKKKRKTVMEELVLLIVNSILLGIGLAMDAFSVSLANGLNEPRMKTGKAVMISGTFAGFQFLMPLAGWLCLHTVVEHFEKIHKFIPWIALALLMFIGLKMIIEGIRDNRTKSKEDCPDIISEKTKLTMKILLVQGIATSIDALSVGFTISEYCAGEAILASLIIGAVTFVICMFGIKIGRFFGEKLAGKAQILGGIILIGIGIEIFVKGIFF